MQKEFRATLLVVLTVAFTPSSSFAQQPQSKCSQIKYSDRLTNAYPYRLNPIVGQAVYGNVSDKGELISASELCVALFNRKDKRLVATVTTESGGQFQFMGVANVEKLRQVAALQGVASFLARV